MNCFLWVANPRGEFMKINKLRRADWFVGLLLALFLAPITRGLGFLLRRDHNLARNKRIAVIKLLGGGNFAIALPLLLGLRKQFPDSELIAVVTPATATFAESIGVFDTIHVIQTRALLPLIGSGFRAWRGVFGVDVVIDLEIHSKLTTCFGLFTCARNRLGFFSNDFFLREYLYTHLLFFNPQAPRPILFQHFGVIMGAKAATRDECREHLRNLVGYRTTRPGVIGVGVGCSDLGGVRKLTTEQWRIALGRIFEVTAPAEVVFLGSKDDRVAAQEIIETIEAFKPGLRLRNCCGELALKDSLRELSECSYFTGIDSALVHFARLLDIPSESFWGPTDPNTLLLPVEGSKDITHYKGLLCSPCIHVAESAPCKGRNLCIEAIFSEQEVAPHEVLYNITTSPEQKFHRPLK